MALYLVQHGKSLPKDIDSDQGLSKEGISEVERMANTAKGYRVQVSRIQHSEKKRARQTAEIFESVLKPPQGAQERSGLKPLDDVTTIAATLNSSDNVMLIGHLPFMERMTAFLIKGSLEPPVFIFQNGGILCLEKHPEIESWVIKWALMPNIA